ncbi:MAG: acetate--CoA ligase family protein [Leucobacter sp.]
MTHLPSGTGEHRSRSIAALFDPRSIAVIGASDDPEKYGNWLSTRALAGSRPAYLVNSRRERVLGHRAYSSASEIESDVDLAVIAVPAAAFESAVDDALAAGAKAIVGITANIGESGEQGRLLERSIAERVRSAGSVLVGPNCLGVFDSTTGLDATVNRFEPGEVALLSQSGNVALDLADQLAECGLGISRFVSLGNQADLDAAELIDSCVEHAGTRAIAIYTEGIRDGRHFVTAAHRAAVAGKPIVLLAAGRSEASARGAASHTGSMVSSHTVVQAACDAAGVEFVSSPREAADLLQGLLKTVPPQGTRAAVFADGGGHAALASDALDAVGLSVDVFSAETQVRVQRILPDSGGTANPIDAAGAGERDPRVFVEVVNALATCDDVDFTLLTGYLGGYGEYSEELAQQEVQAARDLASAVCSTGNTLVAQLMFDQSPAARALREGGVAVYRHVETAAWVLHRLAQRAVRELKPIIEPPTPAEKLAAGDYWNARQALAAVGIPFVDAVCVSTSEELESEAVSLGFPRVLKALGDEHKSDRGGVALNIPDANKQREAWDDMQLRLAPPSVSVEEMADLSDAVELIVGVRRDPSFGPIVLVGAGGTLTELLADTQCALAPIDGFEASRLLRSLKVSKMLAGYRGKPAVDIDSVASLVSKLSQYAAAHPEIGEIECNPVAVSPTRALALDARIILNPVE